MPSIKKIDLSQNAKAWTEVKDKAVASGDNNFCAPAAIAVLTSKPIEEITARLEELGRSKGKGTAKIYTKTVLAELGFQTKPVDIKAIISKFPRPHCDVLKNLTTHHPRRFPGCIDPSKKYLAHCRGHVLAIVDGKVEDWSVNRSLRIWKLEEIVPVKVNPEAQAAAKRMAEELWSKING